MAETITCDYLIVGGGATGMAFADSLLKCHAETSGPDSVPAVVMVDMHQTPGGQWHDSYEFVRLHQPSAMYGVESELLEEGATDAEKAVHRAQRAQILDYYAKVAAKLTKLYNFRFLGGMEFVFEGTNAEAGEQTYSLRPREGSGATQAVLVRNKLVDARFLEPDLPVHVAPKFAFDKDKVKVVPVNELSALAAEQAKDMCFVVIGGGKTGMDAAVYLQSWLQVAAESILWVVPNQAWITARENIGSCLQLLHTTCALAKQRSEARGGGGLTEDLQGEEAMQAGFEAWEGAGRVYRIWEGAERPTKFKDATLDRAELALLRSLPHVLRRGRVAAIDHDGSLRLADGSTHPLPFPGRNVLFVHCSAGAFNYSKQPAAALPPVFAPGRITIQDLYGTPGFCFVGSVTARLEALPEAKFTLARKNAMCRKPAPPDPAQAPAPLGPDSGRVGGLAPASGLVQRLLNLKDWYEQAGLGQWLHADGGAGKGHRLFNLGHVTEQEARDLVTQTAAVLETAKLLPPTGT